MILSEHSDNEIFTLFENFSLRYVHTSSYEAFRKNLFLPSTYIPTFNAKCAFRLNFGCCSLYWKKVQ